MNRLSKRWGQNKRPRKPKRNFKKKKRKRTRISLVTEEKPDQFKYPCGWNKRW